MPKGTVKFYNVKSGFGFIINDETKEEHYVRESGLITKIKDGDSVEFELIKGRKGMNATKVKTC